MDNLGLLKKEIYQLKKEVKDLKEKTFNNKSIFSEVLEFMFEYKDCFEEDEAIQCLYDKITEINLD